MRSKIIYRLLFVVLTVCLALPQSVGALSLQPVSVQTAIQSQKQAGSGEPIPRPPKYDKGQEDDEGDLADEPEERAEWFYGLRTAGDPNVPFSIEDAAQKRAEAAQQVINEKGNSPATAPATFSGAWTPLGPNPILQIDRTPEQNFYAVSGRIGALAIRSTSPYTMYLGAAGGGVWISSTLTSDWTPMTDQASSLSIGALALAPSDEDIIYVGTGEGALSGDSYFSNGFLKSTDGGHTFNHVGGDTFNQVSVSKVVVDENNPDVVYAAILSGNAGFRRVRPVAPTPYGIWKSIDGGDHWTGVYTTTNRLNGATDLVIDPQDPDTLYASFLGLGIKKSVNGGDTWQDMMNGLPNNADYSLAPTRFALGISHPTAAISATLYTGFEWVDNSGTYHPSTVWKSTDEGGSWSETNTAVVGGYCGETFNSSQCFYDNVMGVDPTNPDIVYALGLFNYNTGAGGIFRSMDGGSTWVDIGYGLHPDYHAIAIRKDAPANIVIGSDGGAWSSSNYGGRINPADPPSTVDWKDLNGVVDPFFGTVLAPSNLQITTFTSIDQHPLNNRVYGGNQDNGTLRKFNTPDSSPWVDFASGDGGQVIVDQSNPNFVFTTFFGLSPRRFSDGMSQFFTNAPIYAGLNRNDRSAFYIPWVMDPEHDNRLYLGSYRVYRTDNATAPKSSDVLWQAISPDLTSGCTSRNTSPTNFECVITAFGVTAGGPDVYVGSGDGLVYLSTDAESASPTWNRVDKFPLPQRPVSAFAVDKSNYRIAYVAYSSFNDATPFTPGHVFKTTNGGHTWTDISGDLPDVPVNAILLDPSDPDTLYAGTDVGPLYTTDGGAHWSPLGAGFPIVTTTQFSLNAFTRRLVASSYGRGAWSLTDDATTIPALQVRATDSGSPVGPGSMLTYEVTVKNSGNITATDVTISNPIPDNTTFVSAEGGGTLVGDNVEWSGLTAPVGGANANGGFDPGSLTVTFTVQITSSGVVTTGDQIVNDGIQVTSAEGPGATGSPQAITLAPAHTFTMTPASQMDGAMPGQVITYTELIQNMGFDTDSYNLSTSGNSWMTTIWNDSFTSQIAQTPPVAPGGSTTFGVKVTITSLAAGGTMDTATVMATSTGAPGLSASATIKTTAVTAAVLLVDNDGDAPDVSSYYVDAMDATGISYDFWDLTTDPVIPPNYLNAHQAVVWFAGASYPGPILPYESELAVYLDQGGRLFMSGQDILDQSAGTTAFVHDYLHIDWDGLETQNDIGTTTVTEVPTNTVTAGLGTIPLDFTIFGGVDFSDEITPISPAIPAFLDDMGNPDALSVTAGNYKVIFLAFPLESMGTADNRSDLLMRSLNYFDVMEAVPNYNNYQPLTLRESPVP